MKEDLFKKNYELLKATSRYYDRRINVDDLWCWKDKKETEK